MTADEVLKQIEQLCDLADQNSSGLQSPAISTHVLRRTMAGWVPDFHAEVVSAPDV